MQFILMWEYFGCDTPTKPDLQAAQNKAILESFDPSFPLASPLS